MEGISCLLEAAKQIDSQPLACKKITTFNQILHTLTTKNWLDIPYDGSNLKREPYFTISMVNHETNTERLAFLFKDSTRQLTPLMEIPEGEHKFKNYIQSKLPFTTANFFKGTFKINSEADNPNLKLLSPSRIVNKKQITTPPSRTRSRRRKVPSTENKEILSNTPMYKPPPLLPKSNSFPILASKIATKFFKERNTCISDTTIPEKPKFATEGERKFYDLLNSTWMLQECPTCIGNHANCVSLTCLNCMHETSHPDLGFASKCYIFLQQISNPDMPYLVTLKQSTFYEFRSWLSKQKYKNLGGYEENLEVVTI